MIFRKLNDKLNSILVNTRECKYFDMHFDLVTIQEGDCSVIVIGSIKLSPH